MILTKSLSKPPIFLTNKRKDKFFNYLEPFFIKAYLSVYLSLIKFCQKENLLLSNKFCVNFLLITLYFYILQANLGFSKKSILTIDFTKHIEGHQIV